MSNLERGLPLPARILRRCNSRSLCGAGGGEASLQDRHGAAQGTGRGERQRIQGCAVGVGAGDRVSVGGGGEPVAASKVVPA